MFTDQFVGSYLLILVVFGIVVYWFALGAGFDSRIFLALNFTLITLWVFLSAGNILLRTAALLFMVAFVISNRTWRSRRLSNRIDRLLNVDLSLLFLVISCATIFVNMQSGLTTLAAKEILLEQKNTDVFDRYGGYLLMMGGWLSVHVICTAASQPRWTLLQKYALVAATVAAITSLSKASFLPILLTLLFVYARKIGKIRLILIFIAGLAVTLLMIQRLFDDLPFSTVTEFFFARILKNVDVLDYIEELGPEISISYPHASPFYLLWPFFQFTQESFVVPGVWFHGTLLNDWRGFGPNPTFIGDLLIASEYVGIFLAPMFGMFLRTADDSRYRVFIAMMCYQFLQDWYLSCLNMAIFCLILIVVHHAKMGRRPNSKYSMMTNP